MYRYFLHFVVGGDIINLMDYEVDKKVSAEDVLDACDFVDEFREELSADTGRLTGTAQETAAARLIRDRLHTETGALTRLEAYRARPLEGRGCLVLFSAWYAMCLVLYFVSFVGDRLAGALVTLFTLLLFLAGAAVCVILFLGKGKKLSKILPSKVSYNVVSECGARVCERGKERIIVVAANHDSLYGGYVDDFGKWRKIAFITIPISAALFVLFCILKMAIGADTVGKLSVFIIMPFLSSLAGIFALATHFSLSPKRARENNGTAVSVALASYAYFVENPTELPDDVKLVFASFGGENSAHGGSKAFVAAHPELASAKVICLGDIINGDLTVSSGDAIRKTYASSALITLLKQAAENEGFTLPTAEYTTIKEKSNCLHGFISNAFAQSNISSATVLAKNYNAGTGAVGREEEEKLFSLVVDALKQLMEEQS